MIYLCLGKIQEMPYKVRVYGVEDALELHRAWREEECLYKDEWVHASCGDITDEADTLLGKIHLNGRLEMYPMSDKNQEFYRETMAYFQRFSRGGR